MYNFLYIYIYIYIYAHYGIFCLGSLAGIISSFIHIGYFVNATNDGSGFSTINLSHRSFRFALSLVPLNALLAYWPCCHPIWQL